MRIETRALHISVNAGRMIWSVFRLTIATSLLIIIGCSTGELGIATNSSGGLTVQDPTNFETTLKQNQTALAERKGHPDMALYNIGMVLAHPSNPKKDHAKAIQSFKNLLAEHPRSAFAEPARTWIEVLEQQKKVVEERQKLAEEKRSLSREREMLVQERQKLNYANEKSQQLDIEIEKRRRQLLSK